MNQKSEGKPGYRMPAEWEKHEGTWLQWPHNKHIEGHQLRLEKNWLMMVEALQRHENVHIIASNQEHRDHIVHQLRYFGMGLENVDFHIIPTDDVWARDNGPIFVLDGDGQLVMTNWEFNGWGNRFHHQLDNQVPGAMHDLTSIPVVSPPLILEGGAVEVNGQGTLLATRTSIINPNRNPGMGQEEIEAIISKYLGISNFIWLAGSSKDEIEKWGGVTDGHIDGAARFTNPSTVFYNWVDDKADCRYSTCAKHYQDLKEAHTETGQSLTLVPLPIPENGVHQVTRSAGYEWRKSTLTVGNYMNYYVANNVVLVPVFGNVNDDRALGIIAEHFPGREVIGIDALNLVEGGGAIHCVTQQQPTTAT